MLNSSQYKTSNASVNYVGAPVVTGLWLATTAPHLTAPQRAFLGEDINSGTTLVVDFTTRQSAFLAHTNRGSQWWAGERKEFRDQILTGKVPLIANENGDGGHRHNGNGKPPSLHEWECAQLTNTVRTAEAAHLDIGTVADSLTSLARKLGLDLWLRLAERAGL
jgi:hypothetical protein